MDIPQKFINYILTIFLFIITYFVNIKYLIFFVLVASVTTIILYYNSIGLILILSFIVGFFRYEC